MKTSGKPKPNIIHAITIKTVPAAHKRRKIAGTPSEYDT